MPHSPAAFAPGFPCLWYALDVSTTILPVTLDACFSASHEQCATSRKVTPTQQSTGLANATLPIENETSDTPLHADLCSQATVYITHNHTQFHAICWSNLTRQLQEEGHVPGARSAALPRSSTACSRPQDALLPQLCSPSTATIAGAERCLLLPGPAPQLGCLHLTRSLIHAMRCLLWVISDS
jgi:hypothetical protein